MLARIDRGNHTLMRSSNRTDAWEGKIPWGEMYAAVKKISMPVKINSGQ